MLIIGAGGLGLEILGILLLNNYTDEICFFDENKKHNSKLFNKYPIYSDYKFLKDYFLERDNKFITGIGNPRIREKVCTKIINHGGELSKVVSDKTFIFSYNEISKGTIIQPGVGISHGLNMDVCAAIHINATIGHKTKIGKYVNIGPSASIIGPSEISDFAYIGAQSIILPGIRIGTQAIIPAGSIVKRDVKDFETFTD